MKRVKFSKRTGGAALQVHVLLGQPQPGITQIDPSGFVRIAVQSSDWTLANAEVKNILSKQLTIAVTKFEILFGVDQPNKIISVLGIDAETLEKRLFAR